MNINILYEDKDLLVLDKPSGLVVHSDGKTSEPNLVDWILEHYPGMSGVGEPWLNPEGLLIERPGIVHRLDRETSGVILVVKNQRTFEYIKNLFKERKIEKKYHAFVYGKLKDEEGVIERPIGKSRKDFRLWSAQRGARGELRDAITEYSVVKEGEQASYVELRPKTGRTHQIRVHMKAVHHPVVCDKLYAPNQESLLGLSRLALHASSVCLVLPDGSRLEVSSPDPIEFNKALELL